MRSDKLGMKTRRWNKEKKFKAKLKFEETYDYDQKRGSAGAHSAAGRYLR